MVNSRPSVFLFIGNDDYSKEQAIKKIERSLLDPSSRELDYKVYSGKDAKARDILEYVSTVPFIASKRLVVVKNFEKLSSEDSARLVGYVKAPLEHTCLVLDVQDDSILQDHPELSRLAVVSRFGELTDPQFQLRSKEMLVSMGGEKSISQDAATALKELYGSDLGSISQELQKLSSFVGAKGEIELGDVEQVSGRNLTASAFDLTDAIESNDLKGAISIISELTLAGKKHYEIVGLLCWQMKRLFRGRMLLEKGMPGTQVANTLKISRRYHDRFLKQLKASSLSQIESKISLLLEADLDIKRSRYDPALALEFAVIKLCLGLR